MMGATPPETEDSEFVEVDPTGRYGRYNEILGKGASKTVYRGFDEYEGIEVAWNQVKLYDFLQSPEDLERLYSEIHLLKTLKHKNIMKFYTSWVDPANRNLNFVTEMFTSGTLRQYRQKHRNVNIRAVKHWCRQILRGLLYLHTLDPPVIHRDLKCDNIFVNGNQGEVKIGDLGLAAILKKSHAAHCVGTPEFMAPEVFEEDYNELVDIYSFGMCLLEMVTFEYPYSECTHPAQIYKKVISGKKPDALYRVKDPEVRQFVEKCLATVSERFSARELLKDPFLQIDEFEFDSGMSEHQCEFHDNPQFPQPLSIHQSSNSLISWYSDHDTENGWGYDEIGIEPHGYEIFSNEDDEPSTKLDISIKGKQRDDEHIFLRLRIADKDGRVRNIYFPFDEQTDTALNVATEMVAELDLTDQDVTKIANMIDGEIASLVPEWKTGASIGDIFSSSCLHCVANDSSNASLYDYISSNNPNGKNFCPCTRLECASSHGRFEEIPYQDEGSEHGVTEGASVVSSQSDCLQSMDFWSAQEGPEFTLEGSDKTRSNEESDHMVQQTSTNSENLIHLGNHCKTSPRKSTSHTHCSLIDQFPVSTDAFSDDNEIEMTQELRWLNAKYQIELRELKSQQLGGTHKTLPSSPAFQRKEHRMEDGIKAGCSSHFDRENSTVVLNFFASGNNLSSNSPAHSRNIPESSYPDSDMQRTPRHKEIQKHESRPVHMLVAEGFYLGGVIPHSHHRARSLPVDAVNV